MAKSKRVDKELLKKLHNEIKLSEKIIEYKLLPVMQENLARYTGYFIPSVGVDWDILLNEIYPVVQHNIPSIYFKNPRAFLKPRHKYYVTKRRDPQSEELVPVQLDATKSAKTQEGLLNYALEEIKYKHELQKVLFDALLAPHGVLWHGHKGEFGMTEEQSLFIKSEQVFACRHVQSPAFVLGSYIEMVISDHHVAGVLIRPHAPVVGHFYVPKYRAVISIHADNPVFTSRRHEQPAIFPQRC